MGDTLHGTILSYTGDVGDIPGMLFTVNVDGCGTDVLAKIIDVGTGWAAEMVTFTTPCPCTVEDRAPQIAAITSIEIPPEEPS
jgi:hypothetical protein